MSTPPIIAVVTNAEKSRKVFLRHETSVKFAGSLYMFVGALLALSACISAFFPGLRQSLVPDARGVWQRVLFGGVLLCLSAALIILGRCLRRLNPKAIMPTTIVAGIGLLGFPIGTLINGYILYLIHSEKGKMVFSSDYKAIMQATPHLRPGKNWAFWAIVAFVIAAFLMTLVHIFTDL